MKKIIMILTLSFIFLLAGTKEVKAESADFYEAEYLNNIYEVRFDGVTKHYQRAQFFRRTRDNKAAYCLQPFVSFDPNNGHYNAINKAPTLSNETWRRITDIAGFGYGYPGHTDEKWYAITQMMIWKAIEPNHQFYFTDTLNGNRIDPYEQEIAEIEKLISDNKILPSFANQTYYGIVGKSITLTDTNQVLQYYTTPLFGESSHNGNTFTFKNNNPTCHQQIFYRSTTHDNDDVFFYYNGKSQQLMIAGKTIPVEAPVSFCYNELSLKIKKVDKKTQSFESSGEASLLGTVFTLYDKDMKKVTDITLDEKGEALIIGKGEDSLLDYGTYYLKETKAGTGYQLDETLHTIIFSNDTTDVTLTVENEVIQKELIIKKSFGDKTMMTAEPNVTFEIYDQNDKLVSTITTNEKGEASFLLPYGHYTVKQVTTTEGYSKVKPFKVFIEKMEKDYSYQIFDYKEESTYVVEVPDTYTEEQTITWFLFPFLLGGYYVKKRAS